MHGEVLHCEWGLISKEGWSLIDDSLNYALDENYWWAGPNKDNVDKYLFAEKKSFFASKFLCIIICGRFAHGSNYRQALADFVQVAGRIAMTPRYASGIWWTRWFNFDNLDVLQLVSDYQTRSIPLDVYVLDMDWHTKNDWTGYSWDLRLFPNPTDTLSELKVKMTFFSLNL